MCKLGMKRTPELIDGIKFLDDRGTLIALHFPDYFAPKRFYLVSNWQNGFVRAWHGHELESKLVLVAEGAGQISIVSLEDEKLNASNAIVQSYFLDASSSSAIYIPAGYANGMKSLTKNSKFLVFSDKTLEESKDDDIRFPYDYWDVWEAKRR